MKDNNQLNELSLGDIEFVEEISEEENKEIISIVTDMVYTAPYEQYVINFLNKIIKENYKKIDPLFVKSNYNIKDLVKEFQNPDIIFFKKKDKKNSPFDNKKNSNPKSNQANQIFVDKNNKSEIKTNLKDEESSKDSFSSLKTRVSFEKIFEDSEVMEEKKLFSQILNESEDEKGKRKNYEIKDFFDTFNFIGKEYELHIQILLAQILKCFEEKINSFQFLCNVEFKIENIFPDIKECEFDFLINNLDVDLFKKFIYYLKKNILILNFRGNFYDIKEDKNFNNNINFDIENNKKFNILGEIGFNGISDENKVEQFRKYSKLLNYLSSNNKKNNNKIDLFYEKTGFKRENEKILFFVVNSKFNDVYKYLKQSKLYQEMKKSNVNFILCYLSVGLNEQIILSNYLLNENNEKEKNEDKNEEASKEWKKEEKKEGKTEKKEEKENQVEEKEMKKKEDKEDNAKIKKDIKKQVNKFELDNNLLRKIKISNDSFIKSEKFKHLCFKLNELVSGINKIKKKFFEKEKDNLSYIINYFSEISLKNEIILKKDLQTYFKINIAEIIGNENLKETKIKIIYLKASRFIGQDTLEEKLKKINMDTTIIYIAEDEETSKQNIENLKRNHKFETIYIFICNYKIILDDKMEKFVNEMINNIKINVNNYVFAYNLKYKEIEKHKFNRTLTNNIFILENENEKVLIEQLIKTINEIKLNPKDLNIIYREKKYYDKFIDIYLRNTSKNILKNPEDNKTDFLNKVNEIFYFMSNLDFPTESNDQINRDLLEDLFNLIKEIIDNHIKEEYELKIEGVFKDLNSFFKNKIELLNSSKDKTKNFCFNYLLTVTLKYIYGFFVNDAIPKISKKIYNKKIEEYFRNKQI